MDAAEAALKRGDVRRPGNLYLVKGMAHLNLEEYNSSIKAFKEATKIKETGVKEIAEKWLQHVMREQDRALQLKRSQQTLSEDA